MKILENKLFIYIYIMSENKALKRWSPEEETIMLNEIDNGKTIVQIAEILQRSNNAIAMRICGIGKRLVESNGKTIKEAQKILKIVSVNEIENYIKREKENEKKKEKKDKNIIDKINEKKKKKKKDKIKKK